MRRCAAGPRRPRPVVPPHTPVVDATARAEAKHSDRTGECLQYARAMTGPLREERVWVRSSAICLAVPGRPTDELGEENLDVGHVLGHHQRVQGQLPRQRDAGPGLLELRQRRA